MTVNSKPIETPMSTREHLDADVDGKSVDQSTYRSMIYLLLYIATSRLDIMFSVCLCAHFQAAPKESHLTAMKRILRYLKHPPKGAKLELLGYSDSDFAGYRVDRKSTSEGCHLLGRNPCWTLALFFGSVPLLCDNESAVKITKFNTCTKHIDICHHFLRDHEAKGDIILTGVRSEEQLANIFTKPLDESTFVRL
ncbi:hypothetical protein U9M48_024121 [Paspalum notatum var. saurae]|uniref:Mitochondrial protein n=1 Tax=Paspalum notatum var. saurae TaxID=547442 RepID=A0AAQ3WVP8_PASNO